METISWGIIGCGDVTEVKSGPAFNKVPNSALYAVMRRDISKTADYARRHRVPVFYNDAQQLIHDPQVNAIYIATPPSSHEAYILQAIEAGKPVYVEKPMSTDYASALRIRSAVASRNAVLSVAHYRNAQPFFLSIQNIIREKLVGETQRVDLLFRRPVLTQSELEQPQKAWRVDPVISGGGLFHDLAPHQLATMLQLFGPVRSVKGNAISTSSAYVADDQVQGKIEFESGVRFYGSWDFNSKESLDECIITGSEGSIRFSFFGKQEWHVTKEGKVISEHFDAPMHVQQPMIEKVVQFFLGNAPNPCPVQEGVEVMRLMELMTAH